MGCKGGRGHWKVSWDGHNANSSCTKCSQLGTDLQMHTVWRKYDNGASQKGHGHSHPQPSKQGVSRHVVRVWWYAGDGVGPSSFTKRIRGEQMLPMLREEFGIPRKHVKASGEAWQRYLPAVRWKVWRPKLKKIFDELTAGELTLACPCCRKQFSRSEFTSDFKKHIKAAKNIACLKVASKSKDPVVLEIYNKTLPHWCHVAPSTTIV